MKELYSIDTDYACFGIIAENGIVIEAAPTAKWTIGKSLHYVLEWYKIYKKESQ